MIIYFTIKNSDTNEHVPLITQFILVKDDAIEIVNYLNKELDLTKVNVDSFKVNYISDMPVEEELEMLLEYRDRYGTVENE